MEAGITPLDFSNCSVLDLARQVSVRVPVALSRCALCFFVGFTIGSASQRNRPLEEMSERHGARVKAMLQERSQATSQDRRNSGITVDYGRGTFNPFATDRAP
jgi:hypothetical protein